MDPTTTTGRRHVSDGAKFACNRCGEAFARPGDLFAHFDLPCEPAPSQEAIDRLLLRKLLSMVTAGKITADEAADVWLGTHAPPEPPAEPKRRGGRQAAPGADELYELVAGGAPIRQARKAVGMSHEAAKYHLKQAGGAIALRRAAASRQAVSR